MISEPQMANVTKDQTVLGSQDNARALDQIARSSGFKYNTFSKPGFLIFLPPGTAVKRWVRLICKW